MKKGHRVSALVFLILGLQISLLSLVACDSAKSRAKRIVSLRAEQKEILDELYTEYGGSEVARAIDSNLKQELEAKSPDNPAVKDLGGLVQGFDRNVFEGHVLSVGQGQQPLLLSEKARQFFARKEVVKKAQRVCEIEIELELLDRGSVGG